VTTTRISAEVKRSVCEAEVLAMGHVQLVQVVVVAWWKPLSAARLAHVEVEAQI